MGAGQQKAHSGQAGDVTVPPGQLGNGSIPSGVTVPPGNLSGGTLPGTVAVPALNVTGTIQTSQLSAAVITTSNLATQNLSANQITAGTVSTSRLAADVITTGNFYAQTTGLAIHHDQQRAGSPAECPVSLEEYLAASFRFLQYGLIMRADVAV